MKQALPFEVPIVINGKHVSKPYPVLMLLTHLCIVLKVKTGKTAKQPIPSDHEKHLAVYHEADEATVQAAIDGALAAKADWETMPWNDRAAIFLKAADLISGKYRYILLAATILGQGKNTWQAEVDAAAEVLKRNLPFLHISANGLCLGQLADFFRFGVKFVEQMYTQQPEKNFPGSWK